MPHDQPARQVNAEQKSGYFWQTKLQQVGRECVLLPQCRGAGSGRASGRWPAPGVKRILKPPRLVTLSLPGSHFAAGWISSDGFDGKGNSGK